MDKKKLSEVLKIEEILDSENNRICIISGVGSGKNYFVENVLSNYGNIMYISSRRAKVDEILVNESCSTTAHWEQESNDITVLTNAQVEYVVKGTRYDKDFPNIIEHYDFIVLDEAHSLFTEATYTNAFHVQAFIDFVADNYPSKRIILMTATPEPIPIAYLSKYKIIDKTEECVNVLPTKIEFVTQEQAIKLVQSMDKNEKTVYFCNFAGRMIKGKKSLFKKLIENGAFLEDEISFCMSKSKVQKYQADFIGLEEHVQKVRSYICQNRKLPEKTRILLTTATLKEGVNIEYEREPKTIRMAFCESHLLSDIQQFAGRMRDGLETLYIVDDAAQHTVTDEDLRKAHLDFHCCDTSLLKSINSYYHNYVRNCDSEVYGKIGFEEGLVFFHETFYTADYSLHAVGSAATKYFIDTIESKHDYIRYNHLKHQFELYQSRFDEQCRVNSKLRDNIWYDEIKVFAEHNELKCISIKDKLINLLEPLVDHLIFDKAEKDNLLTELRELLSLQPTAKLTTINTALMSRECYYELVSATKTINRKSERYLTVAKLTQKQPSKPKQGMLAPKELKYYIFNNEKVRFVLEMLGHESIKYHADKSYFSCANVDGDNPTAINIFNDEWLSVRNWTRPNKFEKSADIITLVEYDKQCSFKKAMKYLHQILGLSNIDVSELDFSGMGKHTVSVEEVFTETSSEGLVPIDERSLNRSEPLLHIDWFRAGIMPWTRKKFDLRFSHDEECVVIPIRKWDDGTLVALNRRTTCKNYEMLGIHKYRLSKDYKKSKNVYGLWENRASIEKCGYCVIFEGEKSVLKRHSINDQTGISIHGKSLSDTQAEIILSLNIDEVIIALDKDVNIDEVRFTAEKFYQKKKVSYIFDSFDLLGENDSPADLCDKDYRFLFDNRIVYDESEHAKYMEALARKH